MVRWNAGTEHVKTQRQTLSPAGPKIEIQKGFTRGIPSRGLAHPFGGMAPTMSIAKSASAYECGRFTCTIKQHLGQMPPKHVAGLPTQVVNDKGRSHRQSQPPS
jgi:hypothetical protein